MSSFTDFCARATRQSTVNQQRSLQEKRERIARQMEDYNSDDKERVEKAKVEILEDHFLYVKRIVNHYVVSCFDMDEDTKEDFLQAGITGVFEALKSYKAGRSIFITYLEKYVLQELTKTIVSKSNTSQYYSQLIIKVNKAIASLEDKGIVSPSITMIAEESGLEPETVSRAIIFREARLEVSLMPPSSEEGETIDASLIDHKTPEQEYLATERHDTIMRAIHRLPTLAQQYVMRYLGIDCPQQKVADIATAFSTTPKDVKNVIDRSYRDLSCDSELRNLFGDNYSGIRRALNNNNFGFMSDSQA